MKSKGQNPKDHGGRRDLRKSLGRERKKASCKDAVPKGQQRTRGGEDGKCGEISREETIARLRVMEIEEGRFLCAADEEGNSLLAGYQSLLKMWLSLFSSGLR